MPFNTALSGLNAATAALNVTANNIANADTTGFKESRAEFSDLFAVNLQGVSATATGSGVRLANVAQQFSQGNVNFTNNSLDLAIHNGEGFFTLSDNGQLKYTRAGAFSADHNGYVVNSSGDRLQVFPPLGDGTFNTGGMTDLQLSTAESPPSATSSAALSLNLPANATLPTNSTFDPTDPLSFNQTTSMTVYDSLAASHTATMYYVKQSASNTWDSYTYIDGNAVGGASPLAFGSDGRLTTPASGSMTLQAYSPGNGAADLNLTLNYSDATQFGNSFSVNSLRQDGFASGRLTDINIDPAGVAQARYTNGQAIPLGQVALARFDNQQGLQKLGDTNWGETFASGQPVRGAAGTSSLGSIQAGALESSNVDLTKQLVEMITAQRNFQANSQMISTADKITQTIINIR